MASMMNIGGDSNDMSYRYKMPRLMTKIEGRGNGIKTVLVNIVEVAQALHCSPQYPTKFFGLELGAQSTWNEKTERAIVNGAHQQGDMMKLLEKFIQIFILCPNCHLPEIQMQVKKSSIKITCAACGHNAPLQSAHKLCGYILKYPPNKPAGEKDEKKKGKKKGKKKDKDGDKKKSDEESEESGEEDDEKKEVKVAATGAAGDEKKESAEEKKKEKKKKKDKKAAESDDDEEEEKVEKKKKEEEWFTDTSKEAQLARQAEDLKEMRAIDEALRKTVANIVKESKGETSPVASFKIFLAQTRTPEDIKSELKRIQLARGLDDLQARKVLLEAVLDTSAPATVPDQLKKHAALLKSLVPDKAAAKMLLACVEDLIGNVQPKLQSRTPHILQRLYEDDVLDEASIVAWFDQPAESSWNVAKEVATNIRKKAKPFIEWLQKAEEEEEEDDDE